jgi:osmotically-inducible protein OsmY
VIHQYWAREMNKLRVIVFAPLLSGALCGCVATQACRVKSCANDAQITANIQSLLDQRSEFKPPNFVYVKTVNHVVYLTGQVNTDLVRENAESIVRDAADGTRVVNSIALTYP